jgi:PKD repeat protein
MRKYLLFTVFIAVLLIAACKKDYTAAFNTSLPTYYLNQSITFNNTSTGGTSNWDFGDGKTSTVKSPVHAFNQPGTYTVTLTDGSSVATRTLIIYDGTFAFKVDNETGETLPIFTFSADASDYEIDYIDQGTITTGTQGTTYYTSDSAIYVGGQLPNYGDSTFLVAPPNYPYVLAKNTVNTLTISSSSSIYIVNSIPANKTKVQSVHTNAVLPQKRTLGIFIKHTVQ